MSITRKDVLETASLARLALSDEEVTSLTRELQSVLEHIDTLRRLDTSGVEPMTHAVPMTCPLRADEPGTPLERTLALAGAPQVVDQHFAVPRIIEKGS
jgi:aspartyl-tRNA(Asn)/glutamyl-tRNA(Gln) amidotransferase subunit C